MRSPSPGVRRSGITRPSCCGSTGSSCSTPFALGAGPRPPILKRRSPKNCSSGRSRSLASSAQNRWSFARRSVWRACGSGAARPPTPVACSRKSMAGSPRDSIPLICGTHGPYWMHGSDSPEIMFDGHSLDPNAAGPRCCIPHLLTYHAERRPTAPAILAPGRAPLTYGRLRQHVEDTAHAMRAMGIAGHNRVALVLPNGPEMAVAVLTIAAHAACAPLNPSYSADEVDSYLGDLRVQVLLTQRGMDSPARRVAVSRGLRVVELSFRVDVEAGLFTLTGDVGRVFSSDDGVDTSDVAFLLLTSGTTSRPKVVALTHTNVCTSAFCSRTALALTQRDRCLNVLPLFRGHGLIAPVVAWLEAGGSVVCTPGCEPTKFFDWLTEFRPTWYSAVPTMHRAILAQARHQRACFPGNH